MTLGAANSRIRVLALGRDVGTLFGGAEKIAFELIGRLDPARFKRYLCITHACPPEQRAVNERELRQLEESGVEILRLERRSVLSNRSWLRLYELLRRESIDVLHAHMPRASVPGTIIGRLARVPVIVSHEHGWSFQGKPVRRLLDRFVVARGSDVLLAVSGWDRRQMIEVERIAEDRIRILPNGIPSVLDEVPDVRGELGVAPEVGLIGAVGRLYPEKGYDDLIEAMALLEQRASGPFQCLILGYGPEEKRLRALIDELDLVEQVRLVGFREDVSAVTRALDVAVLSSKNEGSPLAVMEYMAAGAPIVATAVGGVPELIEDGVHGLLVPPSDPSALAAAIGRLLADRALASRLADGAVARQRATYDLDVTVGRLEALYEELYERSRRSRGRRAAV